MLANELISEIIPAVHKNDKGTEALNWMDVFRVAHLPIVENDEYLGLISDADIFDMNHPETPVHEHKLSLQKPYALENQHIYEVISLISRDKLSVLPVLSIDEKYLGVITLVDLTQELSHLMSADNPGGVIILELNLKDYSMSEIAQIAESNDAKILSLYVRTPEDSDKVDVTIKLNRTDISAVIQTFERYNYNIKAIYADSHQLDTMLKDRLDSFLNFLNV